MGEERKAEIKVSQCHSLVSLSFGGATEPSADYVWWRIVAHSMYVHTYIQYIFMIFAYKSHHMTIIFH